MKKSIYSRHYNIVIRLLVKCRIDATLTQAELAKRLGETQSFVSKCERGERRLDIIELREFCLAFGSSLPEFVRKLERKLSSSI